MGFDRLTSADRAVLIYDLAVLALLATVGRGLPSWPWRVALHLLLVPAVWALARRSREGSLVHFCRLVYPLALLTCLYPEVGVLRHLIVPLDLDPLVAGWDSLLFPGRIHATVPPLLPVAVLELLHAAYFSYYLLLPLPALVLWRRGAYAEMSSYVSTLTGCMLAHYAFGILFPVSGPVALRAAVMPEGFLFLPLMDRIYAGFDRGGAAFPSTHAAVAVIAGYCAARLFPRLRWLFAILVAAILVSTVLCTYHYAIDTAAGVLTGGLFLALARSPGGQRKYDSGPRPPKSPERRTTSAAPRP